MAAQPNNAGIAKAKRTTLSDGSYVYNVELFNHGGELAVTFACSSADQAQDLARAINMTNWIEF